ncbi:unnamed protein product [Gadus morhua 'NCC']
MMGCLASCLPNYYANLDRRQNGDVDLPPPRLHTPRKGLKTNQWSRPCLLVTEQETQHTAAYSSVLRRKDEVSPAPVAGSQSAWSTASKIGHLREKLSRSNLTDVAFMIVNEREFQSRAMYWELKRRAPPNVPVYQQGPLQDDVWEILDGDKDDFLVYDRCGLLTFHIVLPYSFLTQPYVEAAVRATSLKDICNCTETFLSGSESNKDVNEQ